MAILQFSIKPGPALREQARQYAGTHCDLYSLTALPCPLIALYAHMCVPHYPGGRPTLLTLLPPLVALGDPALTCTHTT